MSHNIYIYILVASLVATLIRVLPTTLIRKQITNRFVKSFLYYVPYVTLAVMTFPAIIEATRSRVAGIIALVVGAVAAWLDWGLFKVAVTCCVVAYVAELFLIR